MRFKVVILSADAYEHCAQLHNCIQEGEEIRKAVQQMDILEGDLEYWPDFTRRQVFDLAERLKSEKHIILVIACHAYQEEGSLLIRPVDSKTRNDDFPLKLVIGNVAKHGNDGALICFFAACRHVEEKLNRPWDASWLRRLLQDAKREQTEQAHVTFLGCPLGEQFKDSPRCQSFLKDLSRHLKPGAILADVAQTIIKAQEGLGVKLVYETNRPNERVVLGGENRKEDTATSLHWQGPRGWPKLVTSPWFTGHEKTMSRMRADLAEQPQQFIRVILLCGPPGMGKTQCAKKFISTNYQDLPILSVEAENSAALTKSLREFADHMKLSPRTGGVEPSMVIGLIVESIVDHFEQFYTQTGSRGAILVDNFEGNGNRPLSWEDVLQHLPRRGVDIIVTARSDEIPVKSIQIPKLERKDSIQLLMSMMRQSDDASADEAADFCEDCPLALTLFAGFCHEHYTASSGLKYLRKNDGLVAISRGCVKTSFLDGYPHTLQIWSEIMLQMQSDQERVAARVLVFASCLHADGISGRMLEFFVERLLGDVGSEINHRTYFHEVLRILLNRRLIQSDMGDDPRFTVHRFFQEASRLRLKSNASNESKETLHLVFKHGIETCQHFVPTARHAAGDKRLFALESLLHAESFASTFAELGFGCHEEIVLLQIELADYYVRLVGTPKEATRILDSVGSQLHRCEDRTAQPKRIAFQNSLPALPIILLYYLYPIHPYSI